MRPHSPAVRPLVAAAVAAAVVGTFNRVARRILPIVQYPNLALTLGASARRGEHEHGARAPREGHARGRRLRFADSALPKKRTVAAPGYVSVSQEAFSQDIRTLTASDVWGLAGEAMATYLRVVVSQGSAFDRNDG